MTEARWQTFDLRSVAWPDPAVVGLVVAPSPDWGRRIRSAADSGRLRSCSGRAGVCSLAAVRALSGERAEAVRLLRDALAEDPALAANAPGDPDFDALRGDPAFPA